MLRSNGSIEVEEQICAEAQELRKNVTRCEAELQQLYAYAVQQNIDLTRYYHPFAEIEVYLLLHHQHLVCLPIDKD